jgi:hypothetical protein
LTKLIFYFRASRGLDESEMSRGASLCFIGWPTSVEATDGQWACPRSGQAERSGKGGVRGLPGLRQSKALARRRRPSQAQRPGRAPRRRGVRGPPPTTAIQLARTQKKAKPSTAARPGAAGKGDSGISSGNDNQTRTHAQEGQVERSRQAERSGKGGSVTPDCDHAERNQIKMPLDYNSNQRAATARTSA